MGIVTANEEPKAFVPLVLIFFTNSYTTASGVPHDFSLMLIGAYQCYILPCGTPYLTIIGQYYVFMISGARVDFPENHLENSHSC
ncbi:Unannotated [Lentimonas sp. CC19]|nr:Unannotated [Lentimonas sp. CC4]CAA6684886.1 Unannotated [Lentimonas sp. CC6]CAA6689819.1 Unannotated [Lentimonas sp. CC19]CAA6690669.1 Unannotated [Lentimonas sp. CC10]CAA7068923.1 Unannotated [Lentimonas sp. CC11]CAA7170843.1 Unannotated [Lentimonas sp. CC21]CAA7179594.1 Unannotated [Lentimonas sp. CC8]